MFLDLIRKYELGICVFDMFFREFLYILVKELLLCFK